MALHLEARDFATLPQAGIPSFAHSWISNHIPGKVRFEKFLSRGVPQHAEKRRIRVTKSPPRIDAANSVSGVLNERSITCFRSLSRFFRLRQLITQLLFLERSTDGHWQVVHTCGFDKIVCAIRSQRRLALSLQTRGHENERDALHHLLEN